MQVGRMNLLDFILAARNARTLSHFATQFELEPVQVHGVLDMLVPLMGDAVIRAMQTPRGLAALLRQIASRQHERDQEAEDLFVNTRILSNGTGLLSLLFRNEATIRVVACYAGESARVDADLVRQMMPYVATMYMAALSRRSQKPLDRLAGRVPDDPDHRLTGPRRLAELVMSASSTENRNQLSPKSRDGTTIRALLQSLSNLEGEEGPKPEPAANEAGDANGFNPEQHALHLVVALSPDRDRRG